MDKQNGISTYNGIVFSFKKEWNSNTCSNMEEPWKQHAKENKPDKRGRYYMIPVTWGAWSSQIHRQNIE
jgi:hypothetical protein